MGLNFESVVSGSRPLAAQFLSSDLTIATLYIQERIRTKWVENYSVYTFSFYKGQIGSFRPVVIFLEDVHVDFNDPYSFGPSYVSIVQFF